MRRSGNPRLASATIALACTALLATATLSGSTRQSQAPPLPDEVKTWLARDQARRWSAAIDAGEKLFNEGSCRFCHGMGGAGGSNGPNLTDRAWVQGDGSLQNTWEVIFWGVRRRDLADPSRRFEMNPEGGMDLSAEDLDALTAYVWSLSHRESRPVPR